MTQIARQRFRHADYGELRCVVYAQALNAPVPGAGRRIDEMAALAMCNNAIREYLHAAG